MNKNDVTVNYAFQEYIPEKELNKREIKRVSKILTYEEPRWALKDTASALKIIKEANSALYETIQTYIKEQHLPSENTLYLDFGKSLRYDDEYSKETLSDKLDNRFIVRYSHDNDEGNLIDGGDEIIINDENIVSLFNSMIEEHVKENIQKYDEYKTQGEAAQKNTMKENFEKNFKPVVDYVFEGLEARTNRYEVDILSPEEIKILFPTFKDENFEPNDYGNLYGDLDGDCYLQLYKNGTISDFYDVSVSSSMREKITESINTYLKDSFEKSFEPKVEYKTGDFGGEGGDFLLGTINGNTIIAFEPKLINLEDSNSNPINFYGKLYSDIKGNTFIELFDKDSNKFIDTEKLLNSEYVYLDSKLSENFKKKITDEINHYLSEQIWLWKDYDDLSGHLVAPDGKSYFSYDWTTKEYKVNPDSSWDSFLDADPTRDTSLTAFKEYAQKFVKENIVRDRDIKIIFEREYIDTEKLLEEEEKRMAKSETLADKYNRMEKLFEDKLSHLGSGDGETFKELCKWVEEEFPEKDSEGVLLEATSRMIEENLDFAEFDYQNYDDVYEFGDGAEWRLDFSDSAAKELLSGEIVTLSDAQSLIWEKAEKEFAGLKNNSQYKEKIEVTDRINSAFRIADTLYPDLKKEFDGNHLLADELPQYTNEEKKTVINKAFEQLGVEFTEKNIVQDKTRKDELIIKKENIENKTLLLSDFEALIKGHDAVNFGKESLSFTCPNAEQLQTGIENGWGLKEILTGYDVFQELARFNESGQMLPELEAEKEFVPSEYVLNKLKEKGIEVVTDKAEFDRILESQNILQKMEASSDEENNPLFLADEKELKAFSQKVDDWKAGNLKPTEVISEFSTSTVLQAINIPANKVSIDQLVMKKINALETEKVGNSYGHDIDIETIKKIPQYLSDPIMVYNSASRKESYTVLTEAIDKNKESILIALQINKFEDGIYVNNITSAYGKDENEWFIEQIKLGNLVYQDKKRSLEWTNHRRLSLPNQMTTQGSLNTRLFKYNSKRRYCQ